MAKVQTDHDLRSNRLLGALEPASRKRIDPHLESVDFKLGDMVCDAGGLLKHAYFPLRRLQRELGPVSAFVFTSERGAPFGTAGFARMVERAGIAAKFGFKVHPHMLRHATGFALANKGVDTRALQAYLGHKNIQHTTRYTELSPDRFKNFWRT